MSERKPWTHTIAIEIGAEFYFDYEKKPIQNARHCVVTHWTKNGTWFYAERSWYRSPYENLKQDLIKKFNELVEAFKKQDDRQILVDIENAITNYYVFYESVDNALEYFNKTLNNKDDFYELF